jgi:hypothetical protein
VSYIVGATLAVAQSKEGRGKPCPYNLRKSLQVFAHNSLCNSRNS